MHNALKGKRIVVTRPAAQAESFCQKLEAAGARPIRFPTIRLVPMTDEALLRAALANLAAFDWIIFTSVNGVAFTWEALPGPLPASASVAAIGPATADALRARGVAPAFTPEEYVAERIVDGLGPVEGKAILLPRAESARETLAQMLQTRGAKVKELPVYRTLANRPSADAFAALGAGADAVTFTSSSTARNYAALWSFPKEEIPLIACIGPITAMTARSLGYRVQVVAKEYTTDGLLDVLKRHFAETDTE